MTTPLKIGLFGFGCVGQGLYDIIERTHFKAELVKICVKSKNKKRSIPMSYFTFDKQELLEDTSINVIVELIDDAQEAYNIVKAALQSGKHVVTANKKMVAENLAEFIALQEQYGKSLLYEASSCGSIPIIRNLAEYYDNEMLHAVSGIFNGSSNYILTKVIQERMTYDDALRQAQELGFAETDPTLDVGGFDPKYKLCIIAAHAYGAVISPEKVFNYGIQALSAHDIEFATEKGYKLKLLAQVAKLDESSITMFVMPCFISEGHYLYHVENEYNGVIVEAAFSDKQVFVGKGAGGHPTGSAVLSDISALRYDYKYEYRKAAAGESLAHTQDVKIEIYFRYYQPEDLAQFEFEDISIKYSGKNYNYVIGVIRLSQLFEKQELLANPSIFIANTGRQLS